MLIGNTVRPSVDGVGNRRNGGGAGSTAVDSDGATVEPVVQTGGGDVATVGGDVDSLQGSTEESRGTDGSWGGYGEG